MDFFAQQDQARKITTRLVVLFGLAVVAIVLAVQAVVLAFAHLKIVHLPYGDGATGLAWLFGPVARHPELFLGALAFTVTAIFGGSWYRMRELRSGGAAVALSLGARPVPNPRSDDAERQLLNVVEEMAIASGVPVPRTFVLADEHAINAFAAGMTTSDAVVVVTRGCLDQLDRDELQGVVAHEFSHILNGDMRLNLRLLGLMHGILVIGLTGRILLGLGDGGSGYRYRSRDRRGGGGGAAWILMAGVALMALGGIGIFMARLIKAGVSRQREFLADSSAVQFTRNPEGIGNALRRIGGLSRRSWIRHARSEEISHLFFGENMKHAMGSLATHPPVEERIKRVLRHWDGSYLEPRVEIPTLSALEAAFGGMADDVEKALRPKEPVAAGQRPSRRGAAAGSTGLPEGLETILGRGVSPADAAVAAAILPALELPPEEVPDRVATPAPKHVAYGEALLHELPEPLRRAARDPFSARAVALGLVLPQDLAAATVEIERLAPLTDAATAHELRRLHPPIHALGPAARLPLLDLCFPALHQLSPAQLEAFRAVVAQVGRPGGDGPPGGGEGPDPEAIARHALVTVLRHHLDRIGGTRAGRGSRYYAVKPVLGEAALLLSLLARAGHDDPGEARTAFAAGWQQLWKEPRAPADLGGEALASLDRALDVLAQANPGVKRRTVLACAWCVAADGKVTVREAETLRAFADSLDCPLPPFLDTA